MESYPITVGSGMAASSISRHAADPGNFQGRTSRRKCCGSGVEDRRQHNAGTRRLGARQLGQLVKSSYAFDSRTRVSAEVKSEVEKEKCDVRRPPSHNSTSSVAAIYARNGYSEGSTGRRCLELS